jgi:hypothetical protein
MDNTGALRIHNASNGDVNAQPTSKLENRIAKEARDAGGLMRILTSLHAPKVISSPAN